VCGEIAMPKYRKMLNDIDAPYIQSLMRLIETQSKTSEISKKHNDKQILK